MQPAPELPLVEYAQRSDPGRDPAKQVNEDACGHRETRFGHLCVVCDGMGGHAAGREAAELALSTIFEEFDRAPSEAAPPEVLRAAIAEASRRVHAMTTSEASLGRPGSTAVAILLHAGGTEVAHVGDSRAYWLHEGQIFRITRDHSVVQEMVDRGLLPREQAANHPDANRITRALGMAPEVETELRPEPVSYVTGDTFVLCSDGLSDLIVDHEILDILDGVPAAQGVGKLVDLANARGGHDNITVVVIRARTTASGSANVVAPTLAQTGVAQPPATIPNADTTRTLVEAPLDRATELPRPASTAPLEPASGPSEPPARYRRRGNALVIVGLCLAALGVAMLADVLVTHFSERSGKSNTPATPVPSGATILEAVDARAPTALAPEPVVLPAESAPSSEPIAPLEPGPGDDHAAHKKRKK